MCMCRTRAHHASYVPTERFGCVGKGAGKCDILFQGLQTPRYRLLP